MISINDFKLEKIIGNGSYGTVYYAKKITNNAIFAIKKISIHNLTHYQKISTINELKLLSSHNCQYIIQYESAFYHLNDIYIITEYAINGDIAELIIKHKKNKTYFTEDIILKYFIQICIGINYLHKNNIIHRDIKPANLFIDKNDNIKIGDFGIIKKLQQKIMYTQTMVGSPLYISPEIYKSQRYNTKTDNWSLGCVLYEMMTLNPPFVSYNINALKYKIVSGKYTNVTLNYSIPLKQILQFLINTNPITRYSIDNILNLQIIKHNINIMKCVLSNNKIDSLFYEYCIIP